MVLSRRIEHGGNPVSALDGGHPRHRSGTENDNIQPNKRKSTGRIDGPVATFTGMARAAGGADGYRQQCL